jgi:MarR family transcriptional regulator, organic hydroperoxide resistance regulator
MTKSPNASTPTTGFLLWRATNAWQRAQRATLEPFGLTHVQFALLAALADQDARRGLSQAEVSDRSGVDPMTTSQVLRTLQGRNLVERESSTEDKRAFRVTVTADGRALLKRALPKVERTDADFFAKAGRGAAGLTGALTDLAGLG